MVAGWSFVPFYITVILFIVYVAFVNFCRAHLQFSDVSNLFGNCTFERILSSFVSGYFSMKAKTTRACSLHFFFIRRHWNDAFPRDEANNFNLPNLLTVFTCRICLTNFCNKIFWLSNGYWTKFFFQRNIFTCSSVHTYVWIYIHTSFFIHLILKNKIR